MDEMWLARNMNGELWLFYSKPRKAHNYWACMQGERLAQLSTLMFPEVKWSDKEPTKVKLVIEK